MAGQQSAKDRIRELEELNSIITKQLSLVQSQKENLEENAITLKNELKEFQKLCGEQQIENGRLVSLNTEQRVQLRAEANSAFAASRNQRRENEKLKDGRESYRKQIDQLEKENKELKLQILQTREVNRG